jgi:hypothetical protein
MQKSRASAKEHISHQAAAALLLPQEQARTGAGVVMALAAGVRARMQRTRVPAECVVRGVNGGGGGGVNSGDGGGYCA